MKNELVPGEQTGIKKTACSRLSEGGQERAKIRALLRKGVGESAFPGAVLLVAQGGQLLFLESLGHLCLIPEPKPMEEGAIFDLASLTKPLATTLALMKLVGEGKVGLEQPLLDLIPEPCPEDKRDLTPRLLLSHCAGLADWRPYYLDLIRYSPPERKGILRKWVLKDPLSGPPGKVCLYSDLGFIILEWVIEAASGMPMHEYVEGHFYRPLGLKRTFLIKGASKGVPAAGMFSATEDCPWRKRVLQGEVHDENAWVVGGYSGHAGLFGTAEEVHILLNLLREHYLEKRNDYLSPATVRAFFRRQDTVDACTWALGWDTPSPRDSSSGHHFSARSVGHLGFTGTSVWMDLEKDVLVIFLTNRVHPSRKNEKIKAFRPQLHDLIMEELGLV